MRTIASTALIGTIVLNGLLGYSGQHLADLMRLRLEHYGATVPALTMMVLALPPWFYVAGGVGLLVLGLGIARVLSDAGMICAVFGLLVLDIAGLFLLFWGVTHVAIRMR